MGLLVIQSKKRKEREATSHPPTIAAKEEIPNLRSRVKTISYCVGVVIVALPVTVETLW